MKGRTAFARLCAFLVALLAVAHLPQEAMAHDARPASVFIRELPGDRFAIRVRAPESVSLDNLPRISAPTHCENVRLVEDEDAGSQSEQVIACPGGIAGGRFAISYPIYNPSLSTLFRLEQRSAPPLSALLPPSESEWQVPQKASRLGVMRDYLLLGLRHIAAGLDHLLFVAGLLIVAGTWRRSLVVVTGFTLSHSVTLALSALDLVRLPAAPVEAAIALSIVFLAVEILRHDTGSLTYRKPVLVASTFGLLHGFGFADVLREIGIPQSEITPALLSFNLGVEIGQVLFIALLLGLAWVLALVAQRLPQYRITRANCERALSYVIGTLGSFWLISRISLFA